MKPGGGEESRMVLRVLERGIGDDVFWTGHTDPKLIAFGVWESPCGDYFVCQRFSPDEVRLLLKLMKQKQNPKEGVVYSPVIVNVESRLRDLTRLVSCECDNAGRSAPDAGPYARGRPPVGSRGRIEPVDATAERVLGKRRRAARP